MRPLDFYLTKICVASIRHFCESISIHIVKDELNGKFSIDAMEREFGVQALDLALDNYGWCTAKIVHILSAAGSGRRFLALDSDIAVVGRVFDTIEPALAISDFVVSPQRGTVPGSTWFRKTYYDIG